jgi:hypothetical protein
MIRFFPVWMLLGGCAPWWNGGQSGEENVVCEAVDTVVLADGEDSSLGFGGDDLLALAGGEHAGTLAWAKGGETPVLVTVTHQGGEIRFEDREWTDDGSGMEPALGDCPDVVAGDVTLAFATEDGAFDESFELAIESADGAEASFWKELDLDALGGTYEVTEIDPAEYDAVRAFLQGTFDAEGSHGVVDGQAERVEGDPSDPDSTASATAFDIATW